MKSPWGENFSGPTDAVDDRPADRGEEGVHRRASLAAGRAIDARHRAATARATARPNSSPLATSLG